MRPRIRYQLEFLNDSCYLFRFGRMETPAICCGECRRSHSWYWATGVTTHHGISLTTPHHPHQCWESDIEWGPYSSAHSPRYDLRTRESI